MTTMQTPVRPELSAAKRALREALMRGQGRDAGIPRRPRADEAPLSFAQERLWFLDRLRPGDAAYNLGAALRLRGVDDEAALERALGEVVRRHEALRTTFRDLDGSPVQVIHPFGGFALPVEDLSALEPAEREAQARRRAAEHAARPFDLCAGPLFRAALLRLGGDEHVLLACTHHIVGDGWSGHVLLRELSALYDAYRDGRESPLPEPAVQYADYAAWQRRQPPEAEARQLAYWKARLAGAPEMLPLPTDVPRAAVPSFRGGRVSLELPARVLERLRELARGEGATLHMAALAAFQALLARYAGTGDVVVGTPVAGRTRREVEGLIGFFVNTLVLRTDLSGDPTFRQAVRRVRETALGAYQHQDVPFARVVAELQPERSLSHTPLFQVMFSLDEAGEPAAAARSGLRMQALEMEPETTPFDLTLILRAHGGGLGGVLEYAADLFERGTAVRMAEHLARLLEQVSIDPDRPLSAVELMAPAERARVVEEWSGSGAVFPVSIGLHQRFEAQAAARPHAVAVSCEGDSLTYAALNARANRLARRLRALGVGPESRVGLCAERSLDLVVGILAILKAGGAYVPLDPAYPAERLGYMAADSGIRVLLAPSALHDRVPSDGIAVVSLDDEAADESGADLGVSIDPANLAYVIYTSGSTGRPKGVGVTHGNVLRLFAATDADFSFGAEDVWTLFHSCAFDFSVWEIWGALLHGGRLVVVPFSVSRDPAAFLGLLARERVTVLNQTPSAFRALAQADEDAGGRAALALRTVVFGGEALDPASLRGWMARRGDVRPRLVNMYGITETTVHVTHRVLREADVRSDAASPIGTPIADLRTYVLDPAGHPVPPGVPGELHVGGAGLARGYLGRPALTAERFVPDPFGGQPGARLYRSGDRARWRADGTLEYGGRIDQQVKVRGFRIEPGEIEAVLRGHPGVQDAVVVDYEHAPGDRRLAAYVVPGALAGQRLETLPDDTAARLVQDLRGAARERLPEHMVPAVFIPIDRIPLTANGKVDRRALPAPEYRAAELDAGEPESYVEVQLIQVWEELLDRPGIGPTQSFFELGGNSLLALRLFAQVNRRLDCDLPVSTLFEGATVRQMARAIEAQRRSASAAPSSVVPLQPHGALPPLFLVHSADRDVMGYINLVRHLGVDQPVYGLRDLGEDLGRPVSRIAAEHVAALRTVQPHGPYHLCGWSFGGLVAYEMALQLEQAGEPVAFVGLMDTMSPAYVLQFPWDQNAELLAGLGEMVALATKSSFSMRVEALEGLELDAQIEHVVDALHAQGAAPAGFDAERVRLVRQLNMDRHRSLSGYVERPFSGTLTLFRASEIARNHDPFFATLTDQERWTFGWHRLSPRPVQVHPVPGSHTRIGSEPHVRVLAQCMRESLASARRHDGAGDGGTG